MKTATLITTHKPKFTYARTFLERFHQHVKKPHPLYIVFSNEEEADEFNRSVQLEYIRLIVPANFMNYGGIVNIKKFFGLNEIINEYDYVGVYDCDSEIVKSVDFDLVYPTIFNTKVLKANVSERGSNLVKEVAEKLGMFNEIIQTTVNKQMYWWFNEIPVYEKHSFKRFYEWFCKLENVDAIMQDYWCFDYIMYGIWLLTHEGFTIQEFNVSCYWGAVECIGMTQGEKNGTANLFDSYWIANLHNHQSYDKIKIVFHSDTRPVRYA